jgi:hypothetical protein
MADNEEDEGIDLPDDELVEDTDVVFFSADGEEILRLCDNGDIFVHGSLAENDKAVVDGLRAFLKNAGQIG